MEDQYQRMFLLKQIENEISAGFLLVAAARKAYRVARVEEGNGALDQALTKHKQVTHQVSESEVEHIRSISHQLAELREAIDWLQDTHVAKP